MPESFGASNTVFGQLSGMSPTTGTDGILIGRYAGAQDQLSDLYNNEGVLLGRRAGEDIQWYNGGQKLGHEQFIGTVPESEFQITEYHEGVPINYPSVATYYNAANLLENQ